MTKRWDLVEPGHTSATTLQRCHPFRDLPGIKLLDGTPSQHIQQTDKVADGVPSKTKLVIVHVVHGHQWGRVEAELSHVCVLQGQS